VGPVLALVLGPCSWRIRARSGGEGLSPTPSSSHQLQSPTPGPPLGWTWTRALYNPGRGPGPRAMPAALRNRARFWIWTRTRCALALGAQVGCNRQHPGAGRERAKGPRGLGLGGTLGQPKGLRGLAPGANPCGRALPTANTTPPGALREPRARSQLPPPLPCSPAPQGGCYVIQICSCSLLPRACSLLPDQQLKLDQWPVTSN
jgi:hypothetical protein